MSVDEAAMIDTLQLQKYIAKKPDIEIKNKKIAMPDL